MKIVKKKAEYREFKFEYGLIACDPFELQCIFNRLTQLN